MAALDLTALPLPCTKNDTLATTLRRIILPRGARKVSIRGSAALYLQLGVSAAEGDAITSAAVVPLDASVWYDFEVSSWGKPSSPPPDIFVAGQSGTPTLYVLVEG